MVSSGLLFSTYPCFRLHLTGTGKIARTVCKMWAYRQTSYIGRTKSQNLNVSRFLLQSSLPNPLKPGVKLRMKMYLEQRPQAMLQLHLSDQQLFCILVMVLYERLGRTVPDQYHIPITLHCKNTNNMYLHFYMDSL